MELLCNFMPIYQAKLVFMFLSEKFDNVELEKMKDANVDVMAETSRLH